MQGPLNEKNLQVWKDMLEDNHNKHGCAHVFASVATGEGLIYSAELATQDKDEIYQAVHMMSGPARNGIFILAVEAHHMKSTSGLPVPPELPEGGLMAIANDIHHPLHKYVVDCFTITVWDAKEGVWMYNLPWTIINGKFIYGDTDVIGAEDGVMDGYMHEIVTNSQRDFPASDDVPEEKQGAMQLFWQIYAARVLLSEFMIRIAFLTTSETQKEVIKRVIDSEELDPMRLGGEAPGERKYADSIQRRYTVEVISD